MASKPLKRSLSSPADKDGKKTKGDQPDEYVVCPEVATSDVFECSWSEGIQHASCTKLSKEQCNAITNISSNIVFFCTTCLRTLPIALKQFDNYTHLASNTEIQINNYEKTILTTINRFHEETSHKILDLSAKVNSVSALNCQLEKRLTDSYGLLIKGLTDTDSSHAVNTKESLTQLASAVISEQQEKQRRHLDAI